MPWTLPELLLATLAILLVGLSKAGFGGVSLLGMILMAQLIPPQQSTGIILPLLLLADIAAVSSFGRHALPAQLRRLLPPVCLGVIAGWLLMLALPPRLFPPLLGALILSFALAQLARPWWGASADLLPHHPAFAWTLGLLAGVATMLANAAGPLVSLYFLGVGLPKNQFVGTGACLFLIVNLFKLPFSASLGLINPLSLHLGLQLALPLLLGFLLGRRLLALVPQALFEQISLVLTIPAALKLIFLS